MGYPLHAASGLRGYWWLACAMGGSSANACNVNGNGNANANVATNQGIRVPA